MKVLIVNGSPKGDHSITLHTCLYIKKHFPDHDFEVVHAGQRSGPLLKDLSPLTEKMRQADLILFSYPVYTFLVPSQLHALIEKMKEEKLSFEGKFMTQVTTSKHFYDVTAHRFMEENCADLGMVCLPGLSADMEDLLNEKGRRQALDFFRNVCWRMAGKPDLPPEKGPFDIVIVTDLKEEDTGLKEKISLLKDCLSGMRVRVENLRDFSFAGGCIGCMNCAPDGKCIYQDGFDTYLREKIQRADAIVYAFTVRDHSMGSLFKKYDDRQFCNGHRTVTAGSPLAYIVNGDLSCEENLHMLLKARADMGGNYLAGTGVDEASIRDTARCLSYALERNYQVPRTFYGVGGSKIFRDLIFQMQGFMKADHKFFKQNGLYDFPQKRKGTILGMYLAGSLFSNDKLRKKAAPQIREGMISSYRKVLKDF